MKLTPPIRKILPQWVRRPLWGDRERWGLAPRPYDPCWREWQETYETFYVVNQRGKLGKKVNDAGYTIIGEIDLEGKKVLEIGPGDIRHIKYWKGRPAAYALADISGEMMDMARTKLAHYSIPCSITRLERGKSLPFSYDYFDVVVSFYCLEHVFPLQPHLTEIRRILKPGGILAGAIPAEGGLAWGLGRLLTSRRWLKKNTDIDPDKIICWEHPNFADEILEALENIFRIQLLRYWPFPWVKLLDCNLVVSFCCEKRGNTDV